MLLHMTSRGSRTPDFLIFPIPYPYAHMLLSNNTLGEPRGIIGQENSNITQNININTRENVYKEKGWSEENREGDMNGRKTSRIVIIGLLSTK